MQQGSKFENITIFVFSSNKFLFSLRFDSFERNWLAIDVISFEFVEAITQEKSHKTVFATVPDTAVNCAVHVKQENYVM